MPSTILLYYKYVAVADPEALMRSQRELCQELGLKGRIIVAAEGINGTIEGTPEAATAYEAALTADPRFADVHFKRSQGDGAAFPKLSVRVRPEIVSTHLAERDIDPTVTTGSYLAPETLHEWIGSGKEFYLVDMRNDYEHAVGRFAGSVLPAMSHFRELPEAVEELVHLKGKTIVTVCTGGVRCEKASGYLVSQGFADVYQLAGGIVTYMEKYPNQHFQGQLYVFDGRITMGFNRESPERVVVGRCEYCQAPCERFVNCANDDCHRHFLCCDACGPDAAATYCPRPECQLLMSRHARRQPVLASALG